MKRYGILIVEETIKENGRPLHLFESRNKQEEIFKYVVPEDQVDIKAIIRATIEGKK